MHAKPIPPRAGEGPLEMDDDTRDGIVLSLLLNLEHPVWSIDEVAKEFGSQADAEDSCARLYSTGLIHRLGEFVFATRAAGRVHEMRG